MDHEMIELRYQETMEAIRLWLTSQDKKPSSEEAMGIAKAFLSQAAMGLVASMPEGDERDVRRLEEGFTEALRQFVEEKIAEHGN